MPRFANPDLFDDASRSLRTGNRRAPALAAKAAPRRVVAGPAIGPVIGVTGAGTVTAPVYSREPDLDALDAEAREAAAAPTALKGRGTGWRIGHRYQRDQRQPFDEDGPDTGAEPEPAGSLPSSTPSSTRPPVPSSTASPAHSPALSPLLSPVPRPGPPPPPTEVRIERVDRIIATNDSPDIPFEQSINPYRGCEHGCIYCFARPTHAWIDLSPGLDFERIIIARPNAAERLRAAFERPGYRCRTITIGAATDPYQPIERTQAITRSLVEVAAEYRHPIVIVTKNALVERDLDLLAPMAADRLAAVMVTITTADPALARILEPRASSPRRRFRAIETLAAAGVPVALSVGPVIPFINDGDIERIIALAAEAGASSVHYTVIRLPWEVAPLFEQWLADHFPDRAARVMARIRDMRGGRRNDPRFGSRMRGQGAYADLIKARVTVAANRFGLDRRRLELDESKFMQSRSRCEEPQFSLSFN